MSEHVTVPWNNINQNNCWRLAGVPGCYLWASVTCRHRTIPHEPYMYECVYIRLTGSRIGRYMVGWDRIRHECLHLNSLAVSLSTTCYSNKETTPWGGFQTGKKTCCTLCVHSLSRFKGETWTWQFEVQITLRVPFLLIDRETVTCAHEHKKKKTGANKNQGHTKHPLGDVQWRRGGVKTTRRITRLS